MLRCCKYKTAIQYLHSKAKISPSIMINGSNPENFHFFKIKNKAAFEK